MDLEERVALISGATGVLGTHLARELAGRGARLALLGRKRENLDALARELGLPQDRLLTVGADLLQPASARAAAAELDGRFGRLDILLHLVGGWTGGKTLLEVPEADLETMLDQHVRTSFHLVQAFVPALVRNGWGRIIMIGSPAAARPAAAGGPYAIGKAGQEALLLTLARELKGSGVTANLLEVKTIDNRREKVHSPSAENASWTTPEEIAAAVLYLLSEPAGSVSGARLPLHGSA